MTDEDGFRIEAAEQFGFTEITGTEVTAYSCTEAELIAFAKACGRKGLAESATIAENELRNVSLLMSNPPKSSAAWDIRNAINKRIEAIDAVNDPILEAARKPCEYSGPCGWKSEVAK